MNDGRVDEGAGTHPTPAHGGCSGASRATRRSPEARRHKNFYRASRPRGPERTCALTPDQFKRGNSANGDGDADRDAEVKSAGAQCRMTSHDRGVDRRGAGWLVGQVRSWHIGLGVLEDGCKSPAGADYDRRGAGWPVGQVRSWLIGLGVLEDGLQEPGGGRLRSG